jgi:hypothetical protein
MDYAALAEGMAAAGRVGFAVPVTLTDAHGETVATATVAWHVRKSE